VATSHIVIFFIFVIIYLLLSTEKYMDTYLNDQTIKKMVMTLLGVLIVLFAVMALSGLKEYGSLGQEVYPSRTISVSGTGEVTVIPDIAVISVSVEVENKDISTGQEESAKKINAIKDYLKGNGVDEKDIKTINYSINPQYDYVREVCPVGFSCPGGKQKLRGYRVAQSIEVKVRETKDTGKILTGIGELGVTNVYGPNFQVDDEDVVLKEAREMAIQDARREAKELADALGVRLVKVVSFNENGSFPYPAYGMGGDGAVKFESTSRTIPDIPVGENTITSYVTITYEIR